MKTIEEKAKAYDEAIEQAEKEILACGSLNCDAARLIFRLFPDFKDSEDERIRKEMIKYFTEIKSTIPIGSPNHFDRYIAYLERQKEQKPKKFKLGDKVHYHNDDTNVITITGFREDAYLTDSAYGPILFCDEDNWERVEQKPVKLKYWDKEIIQSIISILERDNCFKVVDGKPMRILAHEQEINYLRNLQECL